MIASRTHGLLDHATLPGTAVHPGVGLAGWLGITFGASLLGSLALGIAPRFYEQLVRPEWAPATGVFGPVWSALYLMMALAAWLVWRDRGWIGARPALRLYVGQLAANALWTWLFFGWKGGALALGGIVLLWVLVFLTMIRFRELNRLAGLLLVPYLAWVSVATGLTYSLWRLNPVVLG